MSVVGRRRIMYHNIRLQRKFVKIIVSYEKITAYVKTKKIV